MPPDEAAGASAAPARSIAARIQPTRIRPQRPTDEVHALEDPGATHRSSRTAPSRPRTTSTRPRPDAEADGEQQLEENLQRKEALITRPKS